MEITTPRSRWSMKYFLFVLFFSMSLFADIFKVYTEQNPPYNFLEEKSVSGFSTHLLKMLFAKCGHQLSGNTIQLLPWARAYHEALHEKNTMLYSMARTHEREAFFQWVGPIGKMTLAIIAKKSRHLDMTTPMALHRYKIATIPDTASEKALLSLGFHVNELERFANIFSQLKKLKENRIDAVVLSVESAFSSLEKMGCDISDYEVVSVLEERDLYFAFHKDTNPQTIAHMNETLKTLIK